MSATLIRLKKVNNDWTFSTFEYDYLLEYIPSSTIRGAYWYNLVRLRESGNDEIADFTTLQSARAYISNLGFALLDDIFNPDKEGYDEDETVAV